MAPRSTTSSFAKESQDENWFFNEANFYKKKLSEPSSSIESESSEVDDDGNYKVYPERWWLLATVVILNLGNYAHFVAFPSIAKQAAKHYDQSGEMMDLIPTVSMAFGVPFTLIGAYIVDRYGLKIGLQIGGYLTGIGLTIMTCLQKISFDKCQ